MEFEVGGVPPGRPEFKWSGTHQTMNDLKNVRCTWRGREVVVRGMYGGGEEPVKCWIHVDEWNMGMVWLEELEPMEESNSSTSTMPTPSTYSILESMEWS